MTAGASNTALTAVQAALESARPSIVAQALARRKVVVADPDVPAAQPGQCWLLRWEDTVMLAVITRAEDDHLLVMPVDVNADTADETAIVVQGQQAGFGADVAVFAMLETGVGQWVLDCFVTTLTNAADTTALRAWMRSGNTDALRDGWREGTPTPHDAHPRRLARKDIAERISTLGEADWLDESWSRHAQDTQTSTTPTWSAEAVHEALGATPQMALAITRGDIVPNPEQEALLHAAGLIYGGGQQPRPEVIHDLDTPGQKAAVLALAEQRHLGEGPLRQALAREGLARAARRGPGTETDVSPHVLMLRDQMRRELER